MVVVYGNFSQTAKLLASLINRHYPCVASHYGHGRAALQAELGHRTDTVINWGVKLPHDNRAAEWVNRRAGIDKREQCSIMHNAGIRIPRTMHVHGNFAGMVVRKHIQSHGGQGVSVLPNLAEAGGHEKYIYQEYIEKRAEFRVHVFFGDAICVTRKYRDETLAVAGERDDRIWNLSNGYSQNTVTRIGELMDESLAYLASSAVAALHYQFGAVDIAMGMDGALYVLEVNSAPSLIESRAEVWVQHIVRRFDETSRISADNPAS